MKRYRVSGADFDSGAAILNMEIKESWEDRVKEGHLQSQQQIRDSLIRRYGDIGAEIKLANYRALGSKSWSVIAFHNRFANQARDAFIVGAHYPALTAACALGERILNHLVINLRDDYKETPEYRRVRGHRAFQDWALLIRTLQSWNVLLSTVVESFFRLASMRNDALHFNATTDLNDRQQALRALLLLDEIIGMQFGVFRFQPWFIPEVRGASYIKRSLETDPFIRLVYLPNCVKVGPCHTMSLDDDQWLIHDDYDYGDQEITDEEFRALSEMRQSNTGASCESIVRESRLNSDSTDTPPSPT